MESGRKDRGEFHPLPGALLDDSVTPLEGDFQRFFDNHMLPCPGRLDGRLHVGPAGGSDGDDIDLRVCQHRIERAGCLAIVLIGEALGAFGAKVEAGDQFGPPHVGNGPGVELTDHSSTDDGESGWHSETYSGERRAESGEWRVKLSATPR